MKGQKRAQETEPLWRIEELGEYVGLSVATLRRRVRADEIPHIHIGSRSVRFRRSDIDRWLGLSSKGRSAV